MRHIAIALLFTSPLFLVAGCNKNEATNASGNAGTAKADALFYTIKAGTITGNRNPGINSSFRIQKAEAGEPNAIESDRKGGACIIFRASDLDYRVKKAVCSSDTDCENSGGPGYCDMGSHQCWARPNPAGPDPYCKRSIDPGAPAAWPEGTNIKISDNPIPVPQGLKPNARARTVALLRAKGDAGPPISVWGDPKPIP